MLPRPRSRPLSTIPDISDRAPRACHQDSRGADRELATLEDGKRKARPPVALIVVVGVEVKGASRESV
jgi:hypothetical protein